MQKNERGFFMKKNIKILLIAFALGIAMLFFTNAEVMILMLIHII